MRVRVKLPKKRFHLGDDSCPDRACTWLLDPQSADAEELLRQMKGGKPYPPEARCVGDKCMWFHGCPQLLKNKCQSA